MLGYNVIVLDNVALHKVSEIQAIYPHIDVAGWVPGQRLTPFALRLLFLPAYSPFLNPIEEVFGWLKRRVKQSQPDGAQDLFNVLELGQAELSEDHVAAFFRHMVSYIPACIRRERITK